MKKDATTEEKIIKAGKKLFSVDGYLGTSMSDIAKEVGITKASLYYFYKNKQDLFLRVVEDVHVEVEELLNQTGSGEHTKSDLIKFILSIIDALKPHGALLDPIDPTHFDINDKQFVRVIERELEIDKKAQKFLKSCGVKQTKLASHTLFTSTQGYFLRIKFGVEDITPTQFSNYITTLLIK